MPVKVISLKTIDRTISGGQYNIPPFREVGHEANINPYIFIPNNPNEYVDEVYSKAEVDKIKIELASEINTSLSQIQKDIQNIKKQILEDKPFRNKVVESLLEKERFIETVSKKVASIVQSEVE